MAIDPVCGMTVDEATARSAERDGQKVYFCSEHCRQKFLSSGSSEKPHSPHHHEVRHEPTSPTKAVDAYTCPMHPEVVSDKPGSCPKCGMALELRARTLIDGGSITLFDGASSEGRSTGASPLCQCYQRWIQGTS
ncbi:MAG: YHS domain-containing protein, partial [Pirellulaceae bacterium]|nr:YHS domain-containing protein [Pirellulaceae bacterium]